MRLLLVVNLISLVTATCEKIALLNNDAVLYRDSHGFTHVRIETTCRSGCVVAAHLAPPLDLLNATTCACEAFSREATTHLSSGAAVIQFDSWCPPGNYTLAVYLLFVNGVDDYVPISDVPGRCGYINSRGHIATAHELKKGVCNTERPRWVIPIRIITHTKHHPASWNYRGDAEPKSSGCFYWDTDNYNLTPLEIPAAIAFVGDSIMRNIFEMLTMTQRGPNGDNKFFETYGHYPLLSATHAASQCGEPDFVKRQAARSHKLGSKQLTRAINWLNSTPRQRILVLSIGIHQLRAFISEQQHLELIYSVVAHVKSACKQCILIFIGMTPAVIKRPSSWGLLYFDNRNRRRRQIEPAVAAIVESFNATFISLYGLAMGRQDSFVDTSHVYSPTRIKTPPRGGWVLAKTFVQVIWVAIHNISFSKAAKV